MEKVEKSIGFMNTMVKMVFFGTFVFTVVVFLFVWTFQWDYVLNNLIDRWFTIMVGELVVMGFIQIAKVVIEGKVNQEEIRAYEQIAQENLAAQEGYIPEDGYAPEDGYVQTDEHVPGDEQAFDEVQNNENVDGEHKESE